MTVRRTGSADRLVYGDVLRFAEDLHRCFAVAVSSGVRPLLVVFGQPHVGIGLQFPDRPIKLPAESDVVELVLDGPMEARADAVGLRAVRPGLRMIHIRDGQVELTGVAFDLAAIFSAPVGQDAQPVDAVPGKEETSA